MDSSTVDGKPLTEDQRIEKEILAELTRLGGQRVRTEEDIEQHGTKLILPETMTPQDGVNFLLRHIEQQETMTYFSRTFRFRPWDGAHATQAAMRKLMGTTGIAKRGGFFSPPPEMRTISIGVGKTTQVPWGIIQIPAFGNADLTLAGTEDEEYGTLFFVHIHAERKYAAAIEGLFIAIEDELNNNSIYKGKALDGREEANFLDLSGVEPSKVIYSEEVMTQLDANVWSLLNHTERHRDLNIPLKRAVLLEGPYGTGKTLAAFLTAQIAVANGWTFIYCRPGKDDVAETMATARIYQPAVLFVEDIDNLGGTDQDADAVSELLDLFDGITAKGTELLAVMTTNHPEKIHKGMVRPGRLDAVIHVGALDHGGIQRLIEASVPGNLLAPDLDYERIGDAMDGFLPAFAKEAIDRAARYMLVRGDDEALTTDDFVNAASGLRPQLELMEGASEHKDPDSLRQALARTVKGAATEAVDGVEIHRHGEDWGGRLVSAEANGH